MNTLTDSKGNVWQIISIDTFESSPLIRAHNLSIGVHAWASVTRTTPRRVYEAVARINAKGQLLDFISASPARKLGSSK
jgi:hypothetical protein